MPEEKAGLEVGKANFDAEVLQSKDPVLVVFWAPWSAACRAFALVLDEVMATAGSVKLIKVNADQNPELSLWHGVQSLPTLVYFVEGAARARIVGTASKEAILAQLDSSARNDCALPISGTSHENE